MQNILKKESCIKEMEQIIRRKTEAYQTCTWYLNGVCDDSCELAEDNHKICADLYDADYRKQEWISVDDKFPKHRQKVLVCDERHNMVTAMYVTYDNGGFDWCTSVRLVYKVTHWMPLPQPPETKGETE